MGADTETHYQPQHPIIAVNGIIFADDGQVLLSRRADNGLWCLPGGLVVVGETLTEALTREIREEIGVNAHNIRLSGVYSANNIPATALARPYSIVLCFTCAISAERPGTSEEVTGVKYFGVEDLPTDMIESHRVRIRDASRRDAAAVVA